MKGRTTMTRRALLMTAVVGLAACDPRKRAPLCVVVLIDRSRSVLEEDRKFVEAITAIARRLDRGSRLAIAPINSDPLSGNRLEFIAPRPEDRKAGEDDLRSFVARIGPETEQWLEETAKSSVTDVYGGFRRADEILQLAPRGVPRLVVTLSDMIDDAGRPAPKRAPGLDGAMVYVGLVKSSDLKPEMLDVLQSTWSERIQSWTHRDVRWCSEGIAGLESFVDLLVSEGLEKDRRQG